ncbi:Putative TatD family, metal-dependent hydrolase [Septoria linicola]|uniref:TatD family, metal-dependent hydrolase n=1 Tax=Septoria linicola TaxID=215465 RepID=A0A9Q9EIM4_9PEZI|nr:putative TatD family, metal-dependent hydrolase [Septoria linicola]USW50508.1 Putative TatD family, metal-dependent hydrolase [Septoria linicola]
MSSLCFADVAVTPTAAEFKGIYRNKQQHEPDFDAVLDRASQSGVKHILLTCMSLHDVDFILEICKRRPEICTMTLGVHPYYAQESWDEAPNYLGVLKGRVRELIALGPSSPLKAFGELGLDFDRTEKASKEVQIWAFKAQLDMIVEEQCDLPLFLHCRNAVPEFIEILTPYIPKLPRSGLVHSFVGTAEEMQQLVSLGLDVSVNGFSFQDQGSLEMVKDLPLDKLQIETDSPWGYINANGDLAKKFPVPKETVIHQSKKKDKFELGKLVKERNESCMIAQVATIVAGLKDNSVQEVADSAYQNSVEMFRLH